MYSVAIRSPLIGTVAGCISITTLTGCALVTTAQHDPRDPWQSYNRTMFTVNTAIDDAVMKPVARGYQYAMPAAVNRSISNFFANLADVPSAVNNLLQFKLARTSTDLGRVAVNSSVGVLGLFDVATNIGVPSYKEDFGQTLGYWGINSGPYVVLPILGPSSVRDTIGFAGETQLNPLRYIPHSQAYWSATAVNIIDQRADLLTADSVVQTAALDRYSFLRDAYLQRRANLVADGNPAEPEDILAE